MMPLKIKALPFVVEGFYIFPQEDDMLRIMAMKLTDKGCNEIKGAPARIEAGIKGLEKMGGKVLAFYVTYGSEYDYIAVAEAMNDETAMVFKASLESLGNVKTVYWNAYSPEEFAGFLKKLP
jgi:uncharacterized protein with GYD domain